MHIAILLLLVLLNGLFAMSEIALVTAKKSRLQRLADNGDKGAKLAIELGEDSTQFLSTIQIGITAIGILSGIFGEAALAAPLAEFLITYGIPQKTSAIAATTIVVICITYLAIVVGELVPKRMAQFNAENIARKIARPVVILALLSKPFVFLLASSTNGILRLLGKNNHNANQLTEDDIHAILAEGSQSGIIEKREHEIVRNAIRLDDRQVVSLMTPRNEIIAIDLEKSFEESVQSLLQSNYSRLPVCKGGIDNLLGFISAKDLLLCQQENACKTLAHDLTPPIYVPESLSGLKVLEQFRETGMDMFFVVDEFGELQGLVTLQDLLKALTGEFRTVNTDDVWAISKESGEFVLDGLIPIPELKDLLQLKKIPEERKARYHTLNGMFMYLIAKIPEVGDSTEWENWHLEVTALDGNRIDKVLATKINPS